MNAAKGPPLALMIFKPVVILLNGKYLFILTKKNNTVYRKIESREKRRETIKTPFDLTLKN